ncbi:MAG: hypothetical protein KC733_09130, partial [Candidatus Omnitrophica bacterium]|nr:hypothetical protein [Candidatus Omnitrophota bacterium]
MNSYEFHLTISHLFMGLCLLALSLFVYLKNRQNSLNITFSIYTFCIAWWSLLSILMIHAPNETMATMWDRICLYGAIFIPATFIHFTFTFLRIAEKKKPTIYVYYLLSFIFSLLNTSPLFIIGTEPIYKLNFFTIPGPFYYVYCLCFLLAEIHGFIYLFLSINSSRNDNEKLQRIYFLSATVLGVIGGSQNFNLALRTNIYFTAPWGNHLISLYVILVTYAILKHQLMDIRVVIKNSIIYSLLVTIISLIFIASVIILERLFQNFLGYKTIIGSTLSAIFIGLIFTPLRNKIQSLVDYLFFKGSQLEIAEQNRLLRKEISNTEKFKSIATLASGIAHEIKNPLTAIKTFSEHLDEKKHDPEFLSKFSILVKKEVNRVDEMVHQLLDFAKPAPPKLADTAINK